jgi:hypothetical protein
MAAYVIVRVLEMRNTSWLEEYAPKTGGTRTKIWW